MQTLSIAFVNANVPQDEVLAGVRVCSDWQFSVESSVDSALEIEDLSALVVFDDGSGEMSIALGRALETRPEVARILVGDAGVATRAVAAGRPAQQVVLRSAGGQGIVDAIVRAGRLNALLGDSAVRSVVNNMASIPSAPNTWVDLCLVLADETSTMKDAASVVERDVALAAKVLRVVNTAGTGLARPVSSVSMAATYLGLATIRDMVLALEVFDQMSLDALPGGIGDASAYRVAHVVGTLARRIATPAAADASFSVGLLARIGRLVLASQQPILYRRVIEQTASGEDPSVAEREVFGCDGSIFGAWLLASWGMPQDVVEGVAHVDRPDDAQGRAAPLAFVCHVAHGLIEEYRLSMQHEGSDDDGEAWTQLVSPAMLMPWGIPNKLDDWRDLVREAFFDVTASKTAAHGSGRN